MGMEVSGEVLWHADHNHQVKIKLGEWAAHEDLLPPFADMIGQVVSGTVSKLVSFGAFIRASTASKGSSFWASCPTNLSRNLGR
ncbi:hypothetical protein [Streptomyces sp. ISL-86]|uniref:hypothetical protein n=1 Tax=Streptomyces sp. ISL-86 TaxID=2819187 RepID=UPI001BE74800|nr:hypothetical protein [Streptomyces sp. ISL-86]MBT2457347.1 hypothetical protein [Streptomyces sp. ISL-86]